MYRAVPVPSSFTIKPDFHLHTVGEDTGMEKENGLFSVIWQVSESGLKPRSLGSGVSVASGELRQARLARAFVQREMGDRGPRNIDL